MAVLLKFVNKKYDNSNAVLNVFNYITSYEKTDEPPHGYNVLPECAVGMFMCVKRLYGKTDGQQVIHFFISFSPDSRISAEALTGISEYIASYFYKHQVVFCVHTEQSCLHVHFMVNTVSFADGSRLRDSKEFHDSLYEHCRKLMNDIEMRF